MPILSKRRKLTRPEQPFRFTDLPGEVRNEIYRICMVDDPNPISIQLEPCSDSILNRIADLRGRNNVLVRFKSNMIRSRHGGERLETASLLLVSRQIHAEAVTTLFGHRGVEFRGFASWIALFYFNWRLSKTCRESIRHLEIEFPQLRNVTDQFGISLQNLPRFRDVGNQGLAVLQGFPTLRRLRFHLDHDILDDDAEPVQEICAALQKVGNIALARKGPSVHYDGDGPRIRQVLIERLASQTFKEFGWIVESDDEEVDDLPLSEDESL